MLILVACVHHIYMNTIPIYNSFCNRTSVGCSIGHLSHTVCSGTNDAQTNINCTVHTSEIEMLVLASNFEENTYAVHFILFFFSRLLLSHKIIVNHNNMHAISEIGTEPSTPQGFFARLREIKE